MFQKPYDEYEINQRHNEDVDYVVNMICPDKKDAVLLEQAENLVRFAYNICHETGTREGTRDFVAATVRDAIRVFYRNLEYTRKLNQ